MNDHPDPCWWSWKQILGYADRLGIPNFQRGAVWDRGNRVALLESIYDQSPCGSFVLWSPKEDGSDRRGHGVPLRKFAPSAEPMWLVDGQQRTRAMLDTFDQLLQMPKVAGRWSLVRDEDLEDLRSRGSGLVTGATDDDDDDGDDGHEEAEVELHPWVVVLPAMPVFDRGQGQNRYFGKHSESRNVQRGSMFRRLRPRAKTQINAKGNPRPVPPIPVGTIPLASLLSPQGVFNQESQIRDTYVKALSNFLADKSDPALLDLLDQQLPWGPQFITGHAFEAPAPEHRSPTPMQWSHLDSGNPEVLEMIRLLAGLFSENWSGVMSRFADMLTGNRFAVGWLPPSNVGAAIDAYVRINRAGIRVRPEEQALALLSRGRPNLLDDLAAFTRRLDGGKAVLHPRLLLAHQSDRQMGFAVWMTTVTRYTALAVLGESGRHWLGVSAIKKKQFGYRLDRVGPNATDAGRATWAKIDYASPDEVIRDCAERATPALLLLDSILSSELCLDHRMARPSARALSPLIDLFYRVPAQELRRLREDRSFRLAVARILHWTLLAPYIDKADLERLIIEVHGINEENARNPKKDNNNKSPVRVWQQEKVNYELRHALARYQKELLIIWQRKQPDSTNHYKQDPLTVSGSPTSAAITRLAINAVAINAFASQVDKAHSLQHPAVGWLYAVERRGEAKEFSWSAQVQQFGLREGKVGVRPEVGQGRDCMPLQSSDDDETLYPEKQHIVPFAIARRIVDKGGTRATASPSNAIGNLTWLSRRQNGLDALADRWTVMDRELDGENLRARGMLASSGKEADSQPVVEIYHLLRDSVLDGTWTNDKKLAQGRFDTLCKGRAAWLVGEMQAWLEEPLPDDAKAWLEAGD